MIMKKLLIASVASFALLGAAQAADLPSTSEPAFTPAPAPAPLFTWTGFYGGINVGYGFGQFTGAGAALDNADGFLGGLQAGYNYQINNIVVGLEGDWQLANIEDGPASIENFGTVRARLGFAADRFMPYVTGGYAFANTDVAGESGFHNGWTVGAGVEYAWTDNITTKLEGLYADFGNDTFAIGDAGAETFIIRTGLNFKF
jgi:outer membrane immunogenic protein